MVVDAAMKVHSALCPGFLESAYEACLGHALSKRGVKAQPQDYLPVSACACKKIKTVKAHNPPAPCSGDGIIRIQREVKGRRGKTATAIFGVPLENGELQNFAKVSKRRCGAGGSVKDGVVIIQGITGKHCWMRSRNTDIRQSLPAVNITRPVIPIVA